MVEKLYLLGAAYAISEMFCELEEPETERSFGPFTRSYYESDFADVHLN